MKIAIIGWGSLIWNPAGLPYHGVWETGGPRLPIEFCRISKDGRLTLIIDETHGTEVTSRWSTSPRSSVEQAVSDLVAREVCGAEGIGFLDCTSGEHSRQRHRSQPDVLATIDRWCVTGGLDAAIWTALPFTFVGRAGRSFSVPNALDYLDSLSGSTREKALEYVRNAPDEVDTPVRRGFRRDSRFGREVR